MHRSGKRPAVQVRVEELTLPTYLPAAPDRNPMFLEKRVYQGSSGRVYPIPFTDRIAEKPVDRTWKAIWLENEYIRVLVLPEIGGRIHALQDKTNGYDALYRQPVIKPALVGLAGPWISGGIEFNWPQHHRPATFLPVDFEIEEHADGSATIWCSDHDPLARMKGMHGICLHPGRAYVEVKVRAYNRTPQIQTFLWWANVATRVHEAYQSFFPGDVYYVADHARRSTSEFPLCRGHYYGVNYGERGRKGVPPDEVPAQFLAPHCGGTKTKPEGLPDYAANDLSFYANIPVPTSYMCMGSQHDFFGGYDFKAQAGIVHFANHHISPGKKQWTWGNHEFGYAWDRNLTDADANGEYGPYVEIMAGVYTDNQPDFSFLHPGETKTWSQYWYPIQKIGPASMANLDGAVSLRLQQRTATVGVAVTRLAPGCTVKVTSRSKPVARFTRDLAPDQPLVEQFQIPRGHSETGLRVVVTDGEGNEVISYQPETPVKRDLPPPASEPPAPADIASNDELFVTGLHLDQYRHATRSPSLYWREALRRDPLDARSNNGMGLWHLRRGEFGQAEMHFRKAIERLTRRNGNPADGEPLYNLGVCLRLQGRDDEAYGVFYKAVWNQAWMAAGCHALAEIDCRRGQWPTALDHLDQSLRFNTDNTRARNLKAVVLRRLHRASEADELLAATLALDPLDWWARHLAGGPADCDLQARLDVAHDFARAGLFNEAIDWLELAPSQKRVAPGELLNQNWGALPLVHYTLGWLQHRNGNGKAARDCFNRAAEIAPDYCFPARIEEIAILELAMQVNPGDSRAPYYLGNLLYDRRRHEEAIALWERSVRLNARFATAWRNLGLGYFNIRKEPSRARSAYEHAFCCDPNDARLLYERDQLWKRLGVKPSRRLRELEKHSTLVQQRDDLSVELCALYNQTGQHVKAMQLVSSRIFQPWEGGEGRPLGQHVRSQLALGRAALAHGDFQNARAHFEHALTSPRNLGEAKHLLANQSDIFYWLGCALSELGENKLARRNWRAAATSKGDFQEMSVRAFSEMTFYSALSWRRLGNEARARALFSELLGYALALERAPAKIDFFATSLPTMLLFEDDLKLRQQTTALFLQAQARLGLGEHASARALLQQVLERDPNHAMASDLLNEVNGRRASKPRSGHPSGPLAPATAAHAIGADGARGELHEANAQANGTRKGSSDGGGVVPLAAAPDPRRN